MTCSAQPYTGNHAITKNLIMHPANLSPIIRWLQFRLAHRGVPKKRKTDVENFTKERSHILFSRHLVIVFFAQELQIFFPEVKHVLDTNRVKSKLSQSFKKEYCLFLACKDDSGFSRDEFSCELIALDNIWERILVVCSFIF
ncbi:uncharacterized protein VP01_52g8 [Puccinia sorghi]|uniref:Uncharacterized protein n=1 Tax=Puccinia sorghi TaxID=27349 RepID=A0A0L6UKA7_9BASI|nr:uncharacterized protein VP01_52g8 [Puccinia sorghi]